MNVLVTGGAGFIGSAVVRRLIERTDHTVLNVDALTYAGSLDSLAGAAQHPRHVFVHADIRDAAALRDLFVAHRPGAVLHLAAETHVDRSIDGPGEFIQTNIGGTFVLLEETRRYLRALPDPDRARFRFVHVSTDEVFGSRRPSESAHETTPYDPSSPYAASKAASDHLVRAWHRTYGVPAIVTSSSNNYGPYQFPEKLVPLMILSALRGERLPVYGSGENVRDWLYVDDHADALLAVLERGVPGETYCVAGGSERRNVDVVRAICAVLDELSPDPVVGDRSRLIAFVADRPGHDQRYAMDAAKISGELRWAPRESFESGLRKTVSWYLEHRDWCAQIAARGYRGERLGLGGEPTVG